MSSSQPLAAQFKRVITHRQIKTVSKAMLRTNTNLLSLKVDDDFDSMICV